MFLNLTVVLLLTNTVTMSMTTAFPPATNISSQRCGCAMVVRLDLEAMLDIMVIIAVYASSIST